MNSCVLMAEIIQSPELRYTSDNQTPVAEMVVQFPGLRAEDPPATLKVIGWGNLAQEIQERYRAGDRVVIEGRLSMNTLDRPEGFKEKRAELTAQRIHLLGAETTLEASITTSTTPSAQPAAQPAAKPAAPAAVPAAVGRSDTPSRTPSKPAAKVSAPVPESDFDDIPF
jgi:single-stranded DNA-binding protein